MINYTIVRIPIKKFRYSFFNLDNLINILYILHYLHISNVSILTSLNTRPQTGASVSPLISFNQVNKFHVVEEEVEDEEEEGKVEFDRPDELELEVEYTELELLSSLVGRT